MKHIIIGTAGHIDHGKTSLIKALTGIDCDRLKEEKERGITIELGFAYFDLPSGRRAGIVDVPGHEKFIKHMLAGSTGMDIALLVIAADEGVMPQTTEHMQILSLLNVKIGITVLTKCDLVDEEWLELVELEVRESLKGTFLEHSPVARVSSVNGTGINELVALIDKALNETEPRDLSLPFRMPIDRVFTMQGFGTVVTGTAADGTINEGDTVEVLPSQLSARIRGIRVHGIKVGMAVAGQRTALNLVGISQDDLHRGDIISAPNSLSATLLLDTRLNLLSNAQKTLSNRERIRIFTGASEILGYVTLLDTDEMCPGDSSFVQIRLEEPTAVRAGDRFVIRSYSPMFTIGGGVILDPNPVKHKRFKESTSNELRAIESGGTEEILSIKLSRMTDTLITQEELVRQTAKKDAGQALENLLSSGGILKFRIDGKDYLIHSKSMEALSEKIQKILSEYHKRNPLRRGIPREELRNRVMPLVNSKIFAAFVTFLTTIRGDSLLWLKDFKVEFTGKWQAKRQLVLEILANQPYDPPVSGELPALLKLSAEDTQELLDALTESEQTVKIAEGMYFDIAAVKSAQSKILEHFEKNQELSLAEFRTLINSSRKFALPLLEYFDSQKLTMRVGDTRKLHPHLTFPSRGRNNGITGFE